jgi:hypothetical protein
MIKSWLVAMTAFGMLTGVAVAQTTSSSTTTTQSTNAIPVPMPVPVPGASSMTSTRQITDSNGVQTDQTRTTTNGTALLPGGDVATTHRTTETTTVR